MPRNPGRKPPHGRAVRSDIPSIELAPELSTSLGAGHPWVYRDRVPRGLLPKSAGWVQLRAGGFRAIALCDPASPIALRIYSRDTLPDPVWFQKRVEEAFALRRGYREQGTTAFRLLNGEGDGVPGLVADVYDRFVVVSSYASAVSEHVVAPVVAAIDAVLAPHGIVERVRAERSPGTHEPKPPRLRLLAGREPPQRLIVQEGDMRLAADLYAGQKTGLFLDHRENRAFVRGLSAGRRVLNLFSYTGAFSIAAVLGGATRVTSVDIAEDATAAARDNFELNGRDPEAHEFVAQDVFEYAEAMRKSNGRFGLVVCDPPSFANSREQLFGALRAYIRVNALGLSLTTIGGFYAAASCTAQVSPAAFRETLAEAAARAGVRVQIVHEAGQALDHPQFAGHPEGRYLKFVVGRVLPRV
jgi:23S rRNA (cytosine1962-C5)-methyltransferase